jgi:hypothetical protein
MLFVIFDEPIENGDVVEYVVKTELGAKLSLLQYRQSFGEQLHAALHIDESR